MFLSLKLEEKYKYADMRINAFIVHSWPRDHLFCCQLFLRSEKIHIEYTKLDVYNSNLYPRNITSLSHGIFKT